MTCKNINNLNIKSTINNKKYNYVIIDLNSLTIVPYLTTSKYLSNDNINISPFIESLKFYTLYKKVFKDSKFIFVIDGGISPSITNIYPKYKANRNSRKYTQSTQNILTTKDTYDYNVGLINNLFTYLGEYVISDISRNEADFIIGYILNKISENNNCLVISHDKDLLYTYNKNNTDFIYKQIKEKIVNYIYVDNFECLLNILNFEYIKNEVEVLYYRSLIGDTSDNIDKPFGINSSKIVNNLFYDCYINNIEIDYNYIVNYFTNKFSKNNTIIDKFVKDFRRNLFIMNIYNEEIFTTSEKIKLSSYIDIIKFSLNSKMEINMVYNLFDKYGLYLSKEEVSNMINFIKR